MALEECQETCEGAGQEAGQEYRSGLIRHFPDSNYTVQVGQQGSEETKADYLRPHCGTNNIGGKTYREGCSNSLRGVAIDSKKYQKDEQ